jgi:Polysaccharide pyruvyl transferase
VTTRILLRSPRSPFEHRSPYEMLERNLIGDNTGNLVFLDAAYRLLERPGVEVVPDGFRLDPRRADRINERFDAYVVPFANAFRAVWTERLERWTELIERLRIPVVILGVGAQSDVGFSRARLEPLEAGARRFVRAVLDRGPSIGVRGEFTADWLRGLGFRDVEVIGCPSMFWNGDRLSIERRTPALDQGSRIAITVSPYRREMAPILAHHIARYPNLTYVAQDPASMERLLFPRATETGPRSAGIAAEAFDPLFEAGKVRMFLHPVPWIEYLRGVDFAFGTRIHGAITALLAGTPAFVLAHDSRTLELARYFEIPHRLLASTEPEVDAAELHAEADCTGLVAGHARRWEVFATYLHRHGLGNAFEAGGDLGAAFDSRTAAMTDEVLVSGASPPSAGPAETIGAAPWRVRRVARRCASSVLRRVRARPRQP